MKKLILLFISLLAIGSIFHSCDDTKTYAEQLEEEKDAVNAFIRDHGIKTISLSDFINNDSATNVANNEYVAFSNGVYMQIFSPGEPGEETKFKNNDVVLARYIEVDIMTRDTTFASTERNPYGSNFELYPDGFRYVDNGYQVRGQFLQEPGLAAWAGMGMIGAQYGTAVPEGWLMALKYVRSGARVKLIVPSKAGHQPAQQQVFPFFYDIRKLSIY